MVKQEVFDRVVAHARAQGVKAVEGDYCRYRDSDGAKCFVGCLISDEAYSPDIEGFSAREKQVHAALEASGISLRWEDDFQFLRELQSIHDDKDPAAWERYFSEFASRNGVTYSPPATAVAQ